MAKDSAGSGSAWATGTTSQRTGMSGYPVESRLMFEGTVTGTDMSRATDAREKDRIGILGTGLSYAGSYGRVTSESIGRDLNPLGRGSGFAVVGGGLASGFGNLLPWIPGSELTAAGGNSINNDGAMGLGGGTQLYTCGCCAYATCLKLSVGGSCPCDYWAMKMANEHCHNYCESAKCTAYRCAHIRCLYEHRHYCGDPNARCHGLAGCSEPECYRKLLKNCGCGSDWTSAFTAGGLGCPGCTSSSSALQGSVSNASHSIPNHRGSGSVSCFVRWVSGFRKLCECIKNNTAAWQSHQHYNTYGKTIEDCCDDRRHPKWYIAEGDLGECKSSQSLGMAGPWWGEMTGCKLIACCPNLMKKPVNGYYTLDGGNVSLQAGPGALNCWLMMIAGTKLFQCCSAKYWVFHNLSGVQVEEIAQLVYDVCCCDLPGFEIAVGDGDNE